MLSKNYKIPSAPPSQSLLSSRLMVFMLDTLPARCAIALGIHLGENPGVSMSQTRNTRLQPHLSAVTKMAWPAYRVSCTMHQAVSAGESCGRDVGAARVSRKESATAYIPMPLPGQAVGRCRAFFYKIRGQLFEL
jgi:hypothetical protein